MLGKGMIPVTSGMEQDSIDLVTNTMQFKTYELSSMLECLPNTDCLIRQKKQTTQTDE
jgi:hypothetical protein